MTGQFDLFGAEPPPPRKSISVRPQPASPPIEHFPAPPSLAWARMLTAEGSDLEVHIPASWMWTGVILETLCAGAKGRWWIDRDHKIGTFPPDPGCRARIIYVDPDRADELHRHHPLILITSGDHAALYRLAGPGDVAPAILDRPPLALS